VIDWRGYCKGTKDLRVVGDAVVVTLGGNRTHKVEIETKPDRLELRAVVARAHVVERHDRSQLSIWDRNRSGTLVGFRFDTKGRILGESWVPAAGLSKEEFLLYLRRLAAACDLFEFQLTGRDRE
jgi:hypothetical protein